jgi:uncharacterized protein YkwD
MRRDDRWWILGGIMAGLVLCHMVWTRALRGDELDSLSDRQVQLHTEAQRHRVAHGREPQKLDAELCGVAQRWAETMASRNSMYHGGGEQIIAYGTRSAPATVAMWIGSAPHNAWLLSSCTQAGWGAAQSRSGTWFWAGAFRGGSPASGGGTYTARRFRFFRR